MNKILLLLTLSIISRVAYSQTNNDVYFVFTSIDTLKKGFVYRNDKIKLDTKTLQYKHQPLEFVFSFKMYNRVSYWHFQRVVPKRGEKEVNEIDKHLVVEKPISFLDTINYYDWDDIKDYDHTKWRPITNNYLFNRDKDLRVFLIDRRDIKNGIIKMYQVKDVTTPKY